MRRTGAGLTPPGAIGHGSQRSSANVGMGAPGVHTTVSKSFCVLYESNLLYIQIRVSLPLAKTKKGTKDTFYRVFLPKEITFAVGLLTHLQ